MVIRAESKIASAAPRISAAKAASASLPLLMVDARPSPMIGDINGATSIAPMITAGEFQIKKIVAS